MARISPLSPSYFMTLSAKSIMRILLVLVLMYFSSCNALLRGGGSRHHPWRRRLPDDDERPPPPVITTGISEPIEIEHPVVEIVEETKTIQIQEENGDTVELPEKVITEKAVPLSNATDSKAAMLMDEPPQVPTKSAEVQLDILEKEEREAARDRNSTTGAAAAGHTTTEEPTKPPRRKTDPPTTPPKEPKKDDSSAAATKTEAPSSAPTKQPRQHNDDKKTSTPTTTTTAETTTTTTTEAPSPAPTKPPRHRTIAPSMAATASPTDALETGDDAVPEEKDDDELQIVVQNDDTISPHERDKDDDRVDPIDHDEPEQKKGTEVIEDATDDLAGLDENEVLAGELANEKKEARLFGGFGVFFAIVAMIFTAHQMSENPDGIYASVCRLIITITGCVFKIILLPCRSLFGNRYRSHMPVSTIDSYREPYRGSPHMMELS